MMWFDFLCAAKDKKALLFLGQMLLQVSDTDPVAASLSALVPVKKEDCYSLMLVGMFPMKESPSFCRDSWYFLGVIMV